MLPNATHNPRYNPGNAQSLFGPPTPNFSPPFGPGVGQPSMVPFDSPAVFPAYHDDEPIDPLRGGLNQAGPSASHLSSHSTVNPANGLTMTCVASVVASPPGETFASLLSVIASPEAPVCPVDVVVLADISGSMLGPKLNLLERSLQFVVQELRDCDRIYSYEFLSFFFLKKKK